MSDDSERLATTASEERQCAKKGSTSADESTPSVTSSKNQSNPTFRREVVLNYSDDTRRIVVRPREKRDRFHFWTVSPSKNTNSHWSRQDSYFLYRPRSTDYCRVVGRSLRSVYGHPRLTQKVRILIGVRKIRTFYIGQGPTDYYRIEKKALRHIGAYVRSSKALRISTEPGRGEKALLRIDAYGRSLPKTLRTIIGSREGPTTYRGLRTSPKVRIRIETGQIRIFISIQTPTRYLRPTTWPTIIKRPIPINHGPAYDQAERYGVHTRGQPRPVWPLREAN